MLRTCLVGQQNHSIVQGVSHQAPLGAGMKSSRSTPAIPEEGPAPSVRDFPRSSLDAARMMPTLLEQLQVRPASDRGGSLTSRQ